MYKQIGLVELISAIQKKIEDKTGLRCYDAIPHNAPSPFYFAEVIGKDPAPSKTMYKDKFKVWIHAIAKPEKNGSSVGIYDLIQKLEEALTEDIEIPDDYELVAQMNNGIQTIKEDETKEKHGVLLYEFTVCYGFKCK